MKKTMVYLALLVITLSCQKKKEHDFKLCDLLKWQVAVEGTDSEATTQLITSINGVINLHKDELKNSNTEAVLSVINSLQNIAKEHSLKENVLPAELHGKMAIFCTKYESLRMIINDESLKSNQEALKKATNGLVDIILQLSEPEIAKKNKRGKLSHKK